MSRFIKYIPDTDISLYLEKKPISNHLALIIAKRARRTYCPLENLQIGECFLGDCKKIGITEQQYRTAKQQLTRINFATFRGTNKGTIAKLVNSDVWDINVTEGNEQTNGQATDKTTTNNETTTTNKNVKNKRTKESKELKEKSKEEPTPKIDLSKLTPLEELKLILNGDLTRVTQLDKNFHFGLFGKEWSENFQNEVIAYFRYMESKKSGRWGVIGTLSSQIDAFKSYLNQYSENEIIAALKETRLNGTVSYNPQWTIDRNKKNDYSQDVKKSTNQNSLMLSGNLDHKRTYIK
jgi:hypothetical protein